MPKVSILSPSYNHGKYVQEAVNSVLNQPFQDFDLVIVDDASQDGTWERIQAMTDPRIRKARNSKNSGAPYTTYQCFRQFQGDYMAFLPTDDVYLPEKLQKQVAYLDAHPEVAAVLTWVQIIDDDSQPFEDLSHYVFEDYYTDPALRKPPTLEKNRFTQPNRSRYEWLNHFFHNFNCLCAPTAMLRPSLLPWLDDYFRHGRLVKTADFELWVKICMHHPIHILQEPLMQYRVRAGGANASAYVQRDIPLYDWEHVQVLMNFLDIRSLSDFKAIFPAAQTYGAVAGDDDMVPFLVGRHALDFGIACNSATHRRFGVLAIYEAMGDVALAEKIMARCDFGFPELARMVSDQDIFNIRQVQECKQQIRALEHSRINV